MLDWFTTIPGILVICGVILLVIAIILFIVGAKKSKKGEVVNGEPVNNNVVINEQPSVNVEPIAVASQETVTVTDLNSVSTQNVDVSNNVSSNPIIEPVVINEPVEVSNTITQDVSNVESVVALSVNEVVSEIQPTLETQPSTIYGGEAPVINFTVEEEKPVSIYGGNDPLEATQILPKMEENHAPYGGSYPEVKIVEPVVDNVVSTPVEETVSDIYNVQPISINESEVINIPEPIVIEEPEVTVVDTPVVQPTVSEVTPIENNQEQPVVVEEL